MRYLSLCSGIEAASVAWHPLGWTPVAFSEIEPFPCALLRQRYPSVPNWGDMTRYQEWPDADVDVLVAGTPCQTFSVAGLRAGLSDPRGDLMLTFGAIAKRYRPSWLVWENVPGVLSSNGGRDFGTFLGLLVELGYGWAYRVLDAQYFGLAQRRRRVFVVGSARGWAAAAAVLFERESLRGDPAPSRTTGERVTGPIAGCSNGSGANGPGRTADDADSLITMAHGQGGAEILRDQTPTLNCNHEAPIVFDSTQITNRESRSQPEPGNPSHPLAATASSPVIAFQPRYARNGRGGPSDIAAPLTAEAGRTGKGESAQCVAFAELADPIAANQARTYTREGRGNFRMSNVATTPTTVRRLTPRECERLQGFPDDYTLVQNRGRPAADAPRYKALGNSMAVPVMRWVGERLEHVQSLLPAGTAREQGGTDFDSVKTAK